MNRALSVCLLCLLLLLVGCGKERACNIPIGEAACKIDPNSPMYAGINNCDGYVYLVGGNQGIVVVRTSWSEFAAYERTCPYDTARLEINPEYGNIVVECPKCHSRFNTYADGCPLDGSQTSCYLYEYGTNYDGSLLYISNY